jgi:hypothetical protein
MKIFDSFLRKIKLIEQFTIVIPLSSDALVEKWKAILFKDKIGFFGDKFSSRSRFVAQIDSQEIKFRKDFRSMNKDKVSVSGKGSFTDLGNKTKIDIEIIGLDLMTKIFYIFIIIFFSTVFFSIFKSDFKVNNPNSEYALPLSLFFLILFIIFGYYMMRKSMMIMKYDLERELRNLADK